MKTDKKITIDYLSRSFSELQNLIRLVDTKANIIIGLNGVILSLFFNYIVSKNILDFWQTTIIIMLFFISGFYALITLYPRLPKNAQRLSLLYYMGARELTPKFVSRLYNENYDKEIIEDYVNNIQSLSKIIDVKFRKLRLSYIFFGLAIILKIITEMYVWFYQ